MRLQQTEAPVPPRPKISGHAWMEWGMITHRRGTIREGAVFNSESAVPPSKICAFGLVKRLGGWFDVAGPSQQAAAANWDAIGLRSTEREA